MPEATIAAKPPATAANVAAMSPSGKPVKVAIP